MKDNDIKIPAELWGQIVGFAYDIKMGIADDYSVIQKIIDQDLIKKDKEKLRQAYTHARTCQNDPYKAWEDYKALKLELSLKWQKKGYLEVI